MRRFHGDALAADRSRCTAGEVRHVRPATSHRSELLRRSLPMSSATRQERQGATTCCTSMIKVDVLERLSARRQHDGTHGSAFAARLDDFTSPGVLQWSTHNFVTSGPRLAKWLGCNVCTKHGPPIANWFTFTACSAHVGTTDQSSQRACQHAAPAAAHSTSSALDWPVPGYFYGVWVG